MSVSPKLAAALHISIKPEGLEIAADIFYMKLHAVKYSGGEVTDKLAAIGQSLLEQRIYSGLQDHIDYKWAKIAEVCLASSKAVKSAERICSKFLLALSNGAPGYHYGQFLHSLFKVQPEVALTNILAAAPTSMIRRQLTEDLYTCPHPLAPVPLNVLVAWASREPEERFDVLAETIPLFEGGDDEGHEALSPLAIALLEAAPDKEAILGHYGQRLHPSSWSGSLADILEKRRKAVLVLANHPDQKIANWTISQAEKMAVWAESDRARKRNVDMSFE
ncbi:hypothetical protein [Telmatospirillum sp. J64-1]|uniref:hypothetical protein n=1 Tax=Telmatospirillum sp. J64-1 TaxID=2502183 RepID=UPI00115DEB08|nr:hypothetical protein [Telmatospirillum sp. J64-1]